MQKKIPERLAELRGRLSHNQFARKIGIKQNTYSSWESGEKDPSMNSIMQISIACGVSADWLLGLSNERTLETKSSHSVSGNHNATVYGNANNSTVGNGNVSQKIDVDDSLHNPIIKRLHLMDDRMTLMFREFESIKNLLEKNASADKRAKELEEQVAHDHIVIDRLTKILAKEDK